MIHEKKTTDIGLEYNFSVNLFSGWLLTRLLLPTLKASDTGRVVRLRLKCLNMPGCSRDRHCPTAVVNRS